MTQADDMTAEAAPTGVDDAKSGSDLDGLLREFKTATNSTKDLEPVIEFAKTEMASKRQDALDKDIAKAVETVQSSDEALKGLNPKLVEGLMETYAKQDPAFVKAFENRGEDPKGWEAALVKGGEFARDLLGDLPKARDDREAAQAAVDGTSTEPPPETDGPDLAEIQALSDVDFQKRLREEAAKAAR